MKNYKDGFTFYDLAFEKTKKYDIPIYYVSCYSFFKEMH